MEKWESDFHWGRVRHFIQKRFGTQSLPDLEAILFLIGIQEAGVLQSEFKKEEKMQLMHIGAASLWSSEGYFQLDGEDENGWPNWVSNKEIPYDEKERIYRLINLVISYFEPIMDEVDNS